MSEQPFVEWREVTKSFGGKAVLKGMNLAVHKGEVMYIIGTSGVGKSVTIKPPVYIHPEATVENSTLGPYVSIGKGSVVRNSTIEDAVVEREVSIEDSQLKHSLLGERSKVRGVRGSVNVGDDSSVDGELNL